MFFPLSDINPRLTSPIATVGLIVVNVIVFLFSLSNFEYFITTYGFVPATASVFTALTAMFIHGGFAHLFGNVWYLWLFGDNVESIFGRFHYLFFYLSSGMFAALVHYLTNLGSIYPAIGASGAVSGVLGAYLVFFPRVRVRAFAGYGIVVDLSASQLLILWFVMQFIFGSLNLVGGVGSGIAFAAHVGGFAFGYIYAQVFKYIFPQRIPKVQALRDRIRFPQERTNSQSEDAKETNKRQLWQ